MKEICDHASRSRSEIVEILVRGGTYTCPTLPHDRYDRLPDLEAEVQGHAGHGSERDPRTETSRGQDQEARSMNKEAR